MPALTHELIVDMFHDRPSLAADLLESHLGHVLPTFDRVQLTAAGLTDVVPTEYRADVVVKMIKGRKLTSAVIVEVQQRPDKRKRFTWPAYVGTLHARLKCPVFLLVVCPNGRVATRCAEPIMFGLPPHFILLPTVLDLRDAPQITDLETAKRSPELAVLSARAKMRSLMSVISNYRPVSEWGRSHWNKGKAEGRAEGRAEAVLDVLDARGIVVPDDVRVRVTECTDTAEINTWIRRVGTIEKIDELFD